MPKLRVIQNTFEYYGFFTKPAFDLMGDIRSLVKLLYTTFSDYGVGLGNFRLDGDASDPSTAAAFVRLGLRGVYRFKFDQVHATLNEFNSEQLPGFFEAIQIGDDHLRSTVSDLSFKTHAFFYNSHSELSEGTSTEFLRSLPGRDISVLGEDLGSGIIQNWRDPSIDANVSLTIDHSLQVKNGIFVSYRVLIDRDQVEYIPLAVNAQNLLYATLANVGLEFDEEVEAV